MSIENWSSVATRMVVLGIIALGVGCLVPLGTYGQSTAKPLKKKTRITPTMAVRSGSRNTASRAASRRKAQSSRTAISTGEPVRPAEFNGDVRALRQTVTPEERERFSQRPELEREPPIKKKPLPGVTPDEIEPESAAPDSPQAAMPSPLTTFLGMNLASNGSGYPPDTVGDVGPNHFVQAVNSSVGIFSKTTGTALATFTFNSLWSTAGTGTPCDTGNQGDPTVVYSTLYDRFIVADFAWTNLQNGPYYECVAVSKTGNPATGGWWLYAIRADDAAHPWLPDYPKMSVWPDGLYMGTNMFDCLNASCSSATYKEARAYAFNLSKMVNGTALTANDVIFADTNSTNSFTLLPSNYRGTSPPANTPNYFVQESATLYAWEVFKFHADFAVPANSTFTGPTNVTQSSYTGAANTVPEPAPGNAIDTLADRIMMQVQYKNLAGVESLWVNHTTGTASAATPTGIQWAQINVSGGTVNTTPVQQQIFNNAADGHNRFSGSLAVDGSGNVALGYTVSSSTVAPDIRYVGRLSTDTLGTLPQTEVTMLPALTRSIQTGSCGGTCTRWGDYSSMTLDPADNCTFWYTQMYIPVSGLNWVTRIGSFKFPSCVNVPTAADVAVSGRLLAPNGNGLTNATVSITDMKGVTHSVVSSSFGYFRFDNVRAGESYIISVTSKRFRFTPQTISVSDELSGVNLTAEP